MLCDVNPVRWTKKAPGAYVCHLKHNPAAFGGIIPLAAFVRSSFGQIRELADLVERPMHTLAVLSSPLDDPDTKVYTPVMRQWMSLLSHIAAVNAFASDPLVQQSVPGE